MPVTSTTEKPLMICQTKDHLNYFVINVIVYLHAIRLNTMRKLIVLNTIYRFMSKDLASSAGGNYFYWEFTLDLILIWCNILAYNRRDCLFSSEVIKLKKLIERNHVHILSFWQFVEVYLDYSWAVQFWASLSSFIFLHFVYFSMFVNQSHFVIQ